MAGTLIESLGLQSYRASFRWDDRGPGAMCLGPVIPPDVRRVGVENGLTETRSPPGGLRAHRARRHAEGTVTEAGFFSEAPLLVECIGFLKCFQMVQSPNGGGSYLQLLRRACVVGRSFGSEPHKHPQPK